MAAPKDGWRYASTYDWAGTRVQEWVRNRYDAKTSTILDVGAGWGKYRDLLPEFTMDACEVWPPYIAEEDLLSRYRIVFVGNICDVIEYDSWNYTYDVVILGDVLEHLPRLDAQIMLRRLLECTREVLIIVPFLYVQDEVGGNPYERHEQDDLTPELMTQEYPELRLIEIEYHDDEPFKGFYARKE